METPQNLPSFLTLKSHLPFKRTFQTQGILFRSHTSEKCLVRKPWSQTEAWGLYPSVTGFISCSDRCSTRLYILSITIYLMSTENHGFTLTKERTYTPLITLILAFVHARLCPPGRAFLSIKFKMTTRWGERIEDQNQWIFILEEYQ